MKLKRHIVSEEVNEVEAENPMTITQDLLLQVKRMSLPKINTRNIINIPGENKDSFENSDASLEHKIKSKNFMHLRHIMDSN